MVSLYNRETTDNTAVIESSDGKTHIVKFAVDYFDKWKTTDNSRRL